MYINIRVNIISNQLLGLGCNQLLQQECDNNAGSVGARINKDRQRYCGSTGCRWKICDCMTKEEEMREACQGQAKEKDGPEDGGESRNSKCGHYDWQRERVG